MRISDWSSYVCSSDLDLQSQRQVIDLRFQDPGDLAVPFRAAPDLALGPERMRPQFVNRRMIVILDLIGHRQIGGIENPRFAAEELEQRSEERRVGKECVSTCRSRWSPYH